jgi:hypothetical protein
VETKNQEKKDFLSRSGHSHVRRPPALDNTPASKVKGGREILVAGDATWAEGCGGVGPDEGGVGGGGPPPSLGFISLLRRW